MKPSIIAGAILLVVATGQANASCSDPLVTDTTNPSLQTVLTGGTPSGNTVCATRGADQWQEEHHSDGTLVDFKLGPSDPIDPRKQVGNWTIQGSGTSTVVTYTYNDSGEANGPYSYAVHARSDGLYTFCGADTIDNVKVIASGGGCP